MQSDQNFFPDKAGLPPGNQLGSNYMNAPVQSSFDVVFPPGAKHLVPLHGFEFHPSEVCPKNFIIFDQTDNRSQIMFHPGVAHKFSAPSFNFNANYIQGNSERKEANSDERESSYPLEEDSDDIDALLSSEDEEQDEYDEEEVSTARTYGNYGNMSPDSYSNYSSKPRNSMVSSSNQKSSSSGSSSNNNERKRQKMRKMVKALRGIVPGGDQMNTVAVFDEAVRYLKSLKVEVQKLGVGDLRD